MINTCFTYGPGEESKDYVLAAATYTRDVAPLGTSKWLGGITGPNMPTQAGSANVTADGEGLDCTEIVESWASLNGTTSGLVNGESGLVNGESGLVNGESGTAEQGRVDVT